MPQTRFVLGKALEAHLRPVVVVNKCDRPDGEPDRVVNEVFDLLVSLGADDDALDFPVVYASARDGWSLDEWPAEGYESGDMRPVFEAIVGTCPTPRPTPSAAADAHHHAGLLRLRGADRHRARLQRHDIGRAARRRSSTSTSPTASRKKRGRQAARLRGARPQVEVDRVEAGDLCAVTGARGLRHRRHHLRPGPPGSAAGG